MTRCIKSLLKSLVGVWGIAFSFMLLAVLGFGLAVYETDQAMRYQSAFETARQDAEAESRLCRRHVNMNFVCYWRHGAMPEPSNE